MNENNPPPPVAGVVLLPLAEVAVVPAGGVTPKLNVGVLFSANFPVVAVTPKGFELALFALAFAKLKGDCAKGDDDPVAAVVICVGAVVVPNGLEDEDEVEGSTPKLGFPNAEVVVVVVLPNANPVVPPVLPNADLVPVAPNTDLVAVPVPEAGAPSFLVIPKADEPVGVPPNTDPDDPVPLPVVVPANTDFAGVSLTAPNADPVLLFPNTDLGAVSLPAPKADVDPNENGPLAVAPPLPVPLAVPVPGAGGDLNANIPLPPVGVVVLVGPFFSATGVTDVPVAAVVGVIEAGAIEEPAAAGLKLNANLGGGVVVDPDPDPTVIAVAGAELVGGNILVAIGAVEGVAPGLGNVNNGLACCCCCSLVPVAATAGAGGPTLDNNEGGVAAGPEAEGPEERAEGNAVAVDVGVVVVVVIVIPAVPLAPGGFPNENPVGVGVVPVAAVVVAGVVPAPAPAAEGGCVTPNPNVPPPVEPAVAVLGSTGSAGFAKKLGIAVFVVEAVEARAVVVAGGGAGGAGVPDG